MSTNQHPDTASEPGRHAIVTGASRGFGRAVAAALIDTGLDVVGVARDHTALAQAQAELGPHFIPVPGDAADPGLAEHLLTTYRPSTVVLAAGASPVMAPIQDQTWDSFRNVWEVDVQQVFHWTRQILRLPLAPGSTVIAFSSGAALQGSPLSGGYAGAKSTIRFITSYAAQESARAGLGLRFTCVLPRLTPVTDLGAAAVEAYAARAGESVPAFLSTFGPTSTAKDIATAVLTLSTDPTEPHPAYLLPPTGAPVPA